jgi:hypothetical protein
VSNAQIAEVLAGITGCAVRVRPGAATVRRAGVDVSRIREEFGIAPARLVDRLAELVAGAA